MTEYLPSLKNEILARDGRLVVRPDSGDPVKIICGDSDSENESVKKGAYEILWDVFGGEINSKGYKVLNGKVGMIYGDSITLDRQQQILEQLEAKGFSASNLVLGIGSYTYEYVTRDTYGFAMKATWGQVNGIGKDIFKNPKTDSGFKKSAKGLLKVYSENGKLKLKDQVSKEEESDGLLETVFLDGVLFKDYSLGEIRAKLDYQI
jgi:nicotinamide phosphoribosyltransferase